MATATAKTETKKAAPKAATKTASKSSAAKTADKADSKPAAKTTTKKADTKSDAKATSKKADTKSDAKATDKKAAPKTEAAKSSNKKSSSSDSKSNTTTDHDEIRAWVEQRGGKPAMVKSTGKKKSDTGILRIDFPGYSGEDTLQEISWEDFFQKFDEENLQFLHQTETADGKESRFNKFVSK